MSVAEIPDTIGFADLVTAAYDVAFRLAYGLLHDAGAAEDAVQEAAFKAWRKLGQLREGSPFRPWFLGIVANECRSAVRGRWWSVIRSHEIRIDARDAQPDDLASLELRTALTRLAYDDRLVLVLRYYVDLPYDEIGGQLHISPKAARTRAERALKKLRPLLRMQEVIA